jgi:ATP-dependent Clp protease ATP-binding subunit ClpC
LDEKEIDDIAVLARRTKNNPVLIIGEPGVGKTAVAEGLAQLILTESSRFLDGSLIMALDLINLAGTNTVVNLKKD